MTDRVKSACQSVVQEAIPHEVDFFEYVWDGFWKLIECEGVEDMSVQYELQQSDALVINLGALGTGESQTLDTLSIISVITETCTRLTRDRERELITTDEISTELEASATRIGVRERIIAILNKHATGLLAEVFEAVDWQERSEPNEVQLSSKLWVEWCEQPAASLEQADVHGNLWDREEVEEQFVKRCDRFDLFIHESMDGILIHSPNEVDTLNVPWSKLDARHNILLGLILRSFYKKQSVLTYGVIAKQALNHDGVIPDSMYTSIRRLKSELDSMLNGVLKHAVKASRGMEQYKINRVVRYCWIRPDRNVSCFLRQSP